MAENVFEAVKQSVSTRDAAAFYGIEVKRNGMACCPFHDDKNPSMKLNEEYFYCFGCGATGDVIDFTAKLFDLSPKEAAEKLAQDFGLIYDSQALPQEVCPAENRGTKVSGGPAEVLSHTVRLLLSAEKMGGRQFSPDTGGRTAPPFCGSDPEEKPM